MKKIENMVLLCFGKVGETIRRIVCDAVNVWSRRPLLKSDSKPNSKLSSKSDSIPERNCGTRRLWLLYQMRVV
jgi:hypothetical protein